MKKTTQLSTVTAILFIVFLSGYIRADSNEPTISNSIRNENLVRAQVWQKTNVSTMDILAGPQNEISVPPNAEITCQYMEWTKKIKPSGATPKFLCKLTPNNEVVRIKYGQDTREIFSEVAATRLFWALGFYADELYPVRVRCLGCPENNPFKPKKKERRINRTIEFAVMERKYPGVTIEKSKDQGWEWKELEKVDPRAGGALPAEVDALKLLAVLVQHGDQKHEQQRLGCNKEDVRDLNGNGEVTCTRPILMVQDLGSTFGRADEFSSNEAKMDFERWQSKPVWNLLEEKEFLDLNQRRVCIGGLTNSKTAKENGLEDPYISEAGRRFLATLLMELSNEQIRDLFIVARADKMGEFIEEDGSKRPVTVDDWTAAFLKKRDEIVQRTCP